MSLIDGVITAGEDAGVQCLQWVTDVTGIATSAGGTAFGSAADLAAYAKNTGILSSTPVLGDVAVWNANTNGASGSGHAGLVTGIGSNGQVQVTSTNWPGGQGATQYTVGANSVGMGQPSGYVNPNLLGGNNIITGQTSSSPGTVVGGSVSSTGNQAQTLSQELSSNPWSLTNPFGTAGLFNFLGESSTKYSLVFDVISVGLILMGTYLLFREQADTVISTATGVIPK